MARTVNEKEYTAKRSEILDTAIRLVYTKGFERMTIQDILAELKISSGAFYHYFDSKPAVLEAIIERMQQAVEQPLLTIVNDPKLPATEKLQRFFTTLDEVRIAYKATVIDLIRVWYTDDNAIVRQKVDAATAASRAPLLTAIVRQGMKEGSFKTAYPEYSGEIIQALLESMGNTHAALLLGSGQARDDLAKNIITAHAAYMAAIESVLGLPAESLTRLDTEPVEMWVNALNL